MTQPTPIEDLNDNGILEGTELQAALDKEDLPDFEGPKEMHDVLEILGEATGLPLSMQRAIVGMEGEWKLAEFDDAVAGLLDETFEAYLRIEDTAFDSLRAEFPNGVEIKAEEVEGILTHPKVMILPLPSQQKECLDCIPI